MHKLDALEELPKIAQEIENATTPPFITAVSFIASSVSIVAGIKLLMSNDSTNKYIGGAAVGAGLWQWYCWFNKR